MSLELKKRVIVAEYESPFENFKTVKVRGEIRSCPISNHVTRLLPYRIKEFARIDVNPIIEKSKGSVCPFCPESLEIKTPRFPRNFIPEGRITLGETTLFPNAFPYDEYSAVAVISREHFLTPGQFNTPLLQDGLAASLIYWRRAKEAFPGAVYALLNWNYMPLAGAGLVHPHVQVAALSEPTIYQRLIMERERDYESGGGGSIFDDLVAWEIREQKRYIARTGDWHWVMAFAPRGIYEFWGVMPRAVNALEMEEANLRDLASGLNAILRFLESKGVQAFNMSWYSFYQPELKGLRNLVAVIPRVNFPPFGTSDINYFDRLQGESIAFIVPEILTPEVREFFPGNLGKR
jgi:UDPglucose--hexose-1-phosphate uridylyltransferase